MTMRHWIFCLIGPCVGVGAEFRLILAPRALADAHVQIIPYVR